MPPFFSSSSNDFNTDFGRQQERFLRQFQSNLVRELGRGGTRRRTSSTQSLERAVRRQMEKLAQLTLDTFSQPFRGNGLPDFVGSTRASSGRPASGSFIRGATNDLLAAVVEMGFNRIFNRTRTSTMSYETQRSVEAERAFRESRTQSQARSTLELSKGQRNL